MTKFLRFDGSGTTYRLYHAEYSNHRASIPKQEMDRDWKITVLKLPDDKYHWDISVEPQYKFYVQASICKLDNAPATFYDATLLGEHETAATFYAANLSFYGTCKEDFIRCCVRGQPAGAYKSSAVKL